MQERVELEADKSPSLDREALLDAGHESSEPIEVERPTLSDPLEMVAVEQGALPFNPSSEVVTNSECVSPKQGRALREVCTGWVYRAACRKAKRRGESLPQRAGVRWKRRSRQTR